jgi:hypothetical protein
VILLVVLGGGAGLLAVWSVDPSSRPRLSGRPGLRSLRAAPHGGTTGADHAPDAGAGADDDPARAEPGGTAALRVEPEPECAPGTGPEPTRELVPAGPPPVLEVVAAPPDPERVSTPADPVRPTGPVRRRHPGRVPAAFTAVEGSYREVAVTPLWRKVLSLALLLALLIGIGVGLAAVTAAVLGIAAELVDGAIG